MKFYISTKGLAVHRMPPSAKIAFFQEGDLLQGLRPCKADANELVLLVGMDYHPWRPDPI